MTKTKPTTMPAPLATAQYRLQHPALPASKEQPAERAPADLALSGKSLVTHLKTLHQKASRALILGQGSVAWDHCRLAVQHCNIERLTCEYGEEQARQLCCRLWILYICVLSSLAELAEEDGALRAMRDPSGAVLKEFPRTVRDVWDVIMTAFGGYAGNVDSEVLVPTVLLCLKLRDARTARDIVEAWLATLSDETMYLLQSSGDGSSELSAALLQQKTMAQASYLRVCELYTLHILPQLGDFPSAYDFLRVCTVVADPARNEFTRRLDSLRNPPATPKKRRSKRSVAKKTRPARSTKHAAESGVLLSSRDSAAREAPVAMQQRSDVAATAAAAAAPPATQHNTQVVSPTSQPPEAALPALSSLSTRTPARVGSKRSARHSAMKAHVVARRPRNAFSIAWQVVRRLMARWGFTLFTLAIAVAVLRLIAQRFRLPNFFNAVYRKLWATIKMATQVTYI
ncbi:hypothetical protein GGF46_001932 [Coemansia sp. RSA 552]|nr:hypothetical protein GGF46_001932 [Coemansia sp. RSA 552]